MSPPIYKTFHAVNNIGKKKIAKVFLKSPKPFYPRISTGPGPVYSEEDQAEFQEGDASDGVTVDSTAWRALQ